MASGGGELRLPCGELMESIPLRPDNRAPGVRGGMLLDSELPERCADVAVLVAKLMRDTKEDRLEYLPRPDDDLSVTSGVSVRRNWTNGSAARYPRIATRAVTNEGENRCLRAHVIKTGV